MNIYKHEDLGGKVSLDSGVDVPFDIKRVFYIYGTKPGIPRGQHSHHKIKQYLVAIKGSCKVTLDNGKEKTVHVLDNPYTGLFQDALIWGEMCDFSDDCVLLVLASDHYDESDYIRDYDDFLNIVLWNTWTEIIWF